MCLRSEGEASACRRGREHLGAAYLDRLGRCEIKDSKLETERGDDANLRIGGTEANMGWLGLGDHGMLDGCMKSAVNSGHDPNLIRAGKEEEARGGRPLEGDDWSHKVLRQLYHIDKLQTTNCSHVDCR